MFYYANKLSNIWKLFSSLENYLEANTSTGLRTIEREDEKRDSKKSEKSVKSNKSLSLNIPPDKVSWPFMIILSLYVYNRIVFCFGLFSPHAAV